MINLVFKDLLIQKKSIYIAILYGFIFSFIFSRGSAPNGIFIAVPSVIAYLFISYACAYDDKSSSDLMLNSLPINRRDIVYAKYLSIIVYLLISISISFIFTALVKYSGFSTLNRLMTFEDVLGCFASIIFLSSIYFPIYFKLGYLKSRYISMFLMLGAIFIPTAIFNLLGNNIGVDIINYLSTLSENVLKLMILLVLLVIWSLSLTISMNIYLKKDL
ncbi:ABC-2 transporter permease [Clostridium manihotivorum]|uniref:ABC-2 transporter permease n=1 Tax=Clostridium manihotivorum TaxID=2320868 RepID=A0A3R5QXC0_9CLOT|nr:ABC-2 transporter permease [Clostridium manihotivorum]QAA34845.1 ABC-2 transporter permease [Clostridium manihotivorum]